MKCPDEKHFNHILTTLPTLTNSSLDAARWLQQNREVVEEVMLLNLEALRPDLEAMLPTQGGGSRPWDVVLMARSVYLAVSLGRPRWNSWVGQLKTNSVLRVLIGLQPGDRAPSIGAHYRFLRRILVHSDHDQLRIYEVSPGSRAGFARVGRLNPPRNGKDPDVTIEFEPTAHAAVAALAAEEPTEQAIKAVRDKIEARLPDASTHLDARLMDWVIRVGVVCLADAGLLPKRLNLAVDGTVHRSHASSIGRPLDASMVADAEPDVSRSTDEDAPAAGTYSNGRPRRPLRLGSRAGVKKLMRAPALLGEEARKQHHARMLKRARAMKLDIEPDKTPYLQWRSSSDPDATYRYSNGSKSLEFGHHNVAGTIRIGKLDLPLMSGWADPHEGEGPASLRSLAIFLHTLQTHLPDHRVSVFIGDAGYDAFEFYRYCADNGIVPIIPSSDTLPAEPGEHRAADGTPLCPQGLLMKRHSVQGDKIYLRCPAIKNRPDDDGRTRWVFDPTACPLGQRSAKFADTDYMMLSQTADPRRNLPIARGTDEWQQRYNERTSVERHFAHQHAKIPDRLYRRRYILQIACAMHVLHRQMMVLRGAHRDWLDQMWDQLNARAQELRAA